MYVFVAVAAAQGAVFLVNHIEHGLHRLVVGNAFGVVAFHYSAYLFRHGYPLLFRYLIIAYNAEYDIRSNDGQLAAFLFGEIPVCNFDDAFASHFVAGQVGADGDRGAYAGQSQQVDYIKYLVRWDMVNNCAVFQCGNQQFGF